MIILLKKDPQYRLPYVLNIALTQFALLPYLVAGIIVLMRGVGGLYWLVPAIVISFIKAILDAWVLLVEINREACKCIFDERA